MNDFVIYTDSACDIPPELLKEWGVPYSWLTYVFDGDARQYSNYELPFPEFYEKMRKGSVARTSAVNADAFLQGFEPILQDGKDILYIGFSSGLSGTYHAGCIAAQELREKYPEAKILVIDSLSASRGQGMLLYRAVRERREKNLTIDELDAYVRSIIQSQCHWFIVDDLNHLKRGGRVSSTAALVGTMLGIKPVMHTDSEGRLTPVSKARGTKAALRALVDKVGEIGVEPEKNQPMLICHANCPESVEYIKGLLKERFGVTDVRDEFIGPVIGAHTGCGTLGLFFVGTER